MPSLITVVMLGLAVYAWRGPKECLQVLTVMFLVLNLNPGLFPFWGRGASLRWLVLFSAFGRVLWDALFIDARWPLRIVKPLLLYAFVVAVLASVSSYLPIVSLFKILAFTVGALTILTCFHRTRDLHAYWFSWFFTLFLVIAGLSAPLYFSQVGYFTNNRGFQGIMLHPQTFGPITAPVTAWLIILVVLKNNRNLLVKAGIVLGLLIIVASQARTALLMVVCSTGAVLIFHHLNGRLRRTKQPLFSPVIKLGGAIVCCLLLVWQGERIGAATAGFMLKKVGDVQSESFEIRASNVERQLDNFKGAPFSGIGFGIPTSADDWVAHTTGFLGLPTGFSVEKGFMLSAILEETGLIGAVMIVAFFFSLLRFVIRPGHEAEMAMMLCALLVNSGETVFFSFGAMGLYFWLLIGLCFNKVESTSGIKKTRPAFQYAGLQ